MLFTFLSVTNSTAENILRLTSSAHALASPGFLRNAFFSAHRGKASQYFTELGKEVDSVQISELSIFEINERILHNRLSQNTHELHVNCDSKYMDS